VRKTIQKSGTCAWLIAICALAAGCAGHADRTLEARSALDHGQPRTALKLLNEELDVDNEKALPEKVGGDNALLLLDRAMVLQQLDQYELSSRDLEVSDKQIEILDLSKNAAADIGRYLYSDDVGPYKAPAYEKLMINTMNMVNYLARGDLNGARIEARRLSVMQKFVKETEDPGQWLLGPGSYFAGFVFERSGRPEEALRYYDEALQYGSYRSLEEPVRRLAERAGYRSPRINAILKAAEGAPAEAAASASAAPEDAELLVILNFGRVPAKYARRIPIGLALTYASGAISPADQSKANYLAGQGLVTWVNYPELGSARGRYQQPGFALDGEWQRVEGLLAVDSETKRAWEAARGAVVASAITRMLTRVVAGEALRRSSKDSVVGALLSLGTQAALTVADTPDTRSWATLPARIAIGRVRIKPGTHWVDLRTAGGTKRTRIDVRPGGYRVLNLTTLN
jgi:hypothetical protein